MSGLTLRDVRKSFGSVHIIHGVNLDIEDGEFTVFVGPSGCGKSTLLRLVAGLEECTGGSISIGGQDVTQIEPADRGVAMVFQSYALYPHMTVQENMGFGLKMTGTDRAVISQRVDKASKILHLDSCLTASRSSFPAANASALQLAAPLCASRKYFCLMSRCQTLMRNCACRCALRLPSCTSN